MKILALSRWFPYPPDNGSKIRIYNILKQLASQHEIVLLALAADDEGSPEAMAALRQWCTQVKTVPKRAFDAHQWRTWPGFFSPWPRHHYQTFSHELQALVAREIRAHKFHLGIAFQLDMARYLLGYHQFPKVLEEVELTMIAESAARETHPLRRLRRQLTLWKTRWFVNRLLRNYDFCTVVSEQEQALLRRLAPHYQSMVVVVNGVDPSHYRGPFGPPQGDSLVYPGALTYSANFDAMSFFLSEIFPLIKRAAPHATLRITGKTTGLPLEQLPRQDGVIFTGYLNDIRPCIAQSWVSVVPLRVGGGSRLKILESLALGTPVVATSKGAEGLDFIPGHEILIADDPAEFAAAVLRLLQDPLLRETLGQRGRQAVQCRYDWQIVGQRLNDVIEMAISQPARAPGRR
jgi:glycosyltransferase involved in cell wall biosynthesis